MARAGTELIPPSNGFACFARARDYLPRIGTFLGTFAYLCDTRAARCYCLCRFGSRGVCARVGSFCTRSVHDDHIMIQAFSRSSGPR